jgi:tight adherence protein B
MNMSMVVPLGLGVTVFVALIALLWRGNGNGKAASRLDALVGQRPTENSSDLLRTIDFESEKRSMLELMAAKIPNLERIFEQADCNIRPSQLILLSVIFAALGMTGSWLMHAPWPFIPMVGALVSLIPWGWLWNKRRARLKTFGSQLPDALELVARALRAGHSLAAGMHVVAEEMPSPIAEEFGRVYDEQNLGIPLDEAMRGMTERVPNLDLRFFITSVAIQRQTGGDLAEILDKIGYVVRERYRILGQVKALTAEGRLSGVILIALPFVLFLVILHLKPDYVAKLWEDKDGIKLSIFAIFMQILGAAMIKKIVDIKV